jgi:NADPH:quinone reductase-like Zn-dependent oxidoreductase
MKAAVIHTFGEPPRFEEFPDPTPGAGEVMVHVLAAGLHPIVRALADGSHYGSTDALPMIPGADGVGQLDDGTRVYFGMARPPYGTMAERAAVPRAMCLPLPESLDGVTAAALFNPGMSAWLALTWRAQLAPGETVLILGATGAAGKLAVQIAKRLGAGNVIAVGRNKQVLNILPELGAAATISLDQPDEDLSRAIARAAGTTGVHVIIDYLWGRPTEAVIAALTREGLTHVAPRVRLIEVGQMAGPTITLPASVLRSSGLEIYGSGAGTVPVERVMEAIPQFIEFAASGKLRIETEQVPLAAIEDAWSRQTPDNRRLVVIP